MICHDMQPFLRKKSYPKIILNSKDPSFEASVFRCWFSLGSMFCLIAAASTSYALVCVYLYIYIILHLHACSYWTILTLHMIHIYIYTVRTVNINTVHQYSVCSFWTWHTFNSISLNWFTTLLDGHLITKSFHHLPSGLHWDPDRKGKKQPAQGYHVVLWSFYCLCRPCGKNLKSGFEWLWLVLECRASCHTYLEASHAECLHGHWTNIPWPSAEPETRKCDHV